MQNSRTICVTAQKLGIPKSTVSFVFQTALSHGEAKVAESIQLPDTQLLETFYPPTTKADKELDGVEVHKKLARWNVTLKLLYDPYNKGDADENLDQTPGMGFKLCTHRKKSTTS